MRLKAARAGRWHKSEEQLEIRKATKLANGYRLIRMFVRAQETESSVPLQQVHQERFLRNHLGAACV